ncbi:hypothetical protein JANAI62_15840 [Jannaschia pagri]|uniref:Uncharacterized protein n=1 Tax=Jannaschia pagri TaxID=2829797 RepID=A0ABQ4NKN6_9RHOB|nr:MULTISPECIES: hypothetical protein [unclassified Jannaschia]GIT91129.1 hypothetical protein JANAI61_15870 [Jannaschia sp. AI_61]GIT94961.1 hypothetical protein JANAI62_15840 [Jannaschia sp. AI_62]
MANQQSLALKIAAVLWVVWGLVHMFAGIMTILNGTSAAVAAIADGVDPAFLVLDYHPAVGAVLNQHGFNLLWIGTFTTLGAVFVWRGSAVGIFMTAIVGWVTDVGYFVFMDLGGFVKVFPGTVMTIVSTAAVVLSLWAYATGRRGPANGSS